MKKLLLLLALCCCPLLLHSQGQGMSYQDSVLLDKIRQARYVGLSPTVASLGILHYSDLHGDDVSVAKLHAFLEKFQPYVDALLNTGDAVQFYAEATRDYPHDAKWWAGTGLAEKSLFVLGNHDGAVDSNAKGHYDLSADWDFMGKEWDFDTFFADYIEVLGYSMPEGYDDPASPYYKSCFWVKDYAPAKIRIIGLDCIHFNETFRYKTPEQEIWLQKRLHETLDPESDVYGYSVIFASHFPLDDFAGDNRTWDEAAHGFVYNRNPEGGRVIDHRTDDATNFHSISITSYPADRRFCLRTRVAAPDRPGGFVVTDVNPIGDIIRDWIREGGRYVVWLSGHRHCDMLYYPAKYPDMLCLAIDQAGNMRGNRWADRSADSDARFCANYYSVDTQNGLFKIVRVGLSRDRFLVEKNVLCYDYVNRKVIFE